MRRCLGSLYPAYFQFFRIKAKPQMIGFLAVFFWRAYWGRKCGCHDRTNWCGLPDGCGQWVIEILPWHSSHKILFPLKESPKWSDRGKRLFVYSHFISFSLITLEISFYFLGCKEIYNRCLIFQTLVWNCVGMAFVPFRKISDYFTLIEVELHGTWKLNHNQQSRGIQLSQENKMW